MARRSSSDSSPSLTPMSTAMPSALAPSFTSTRVPLAVMMRSDTPVPGAPRSWLLRADADTPSVAADCRIKDCE